MPILQKIRNPIILIVGYILKKIIRKIFFSHIENKDFNNLITIILDSLPNETVINILKLIKNLYFSKPSELFSYRILNEAMIHSIPIDQRMSIISTEDKKIKYLFLVLIVGNVLNRSISGIKKIILLPFKLGVYSFIAFLFGIKLDYLLSFFDFFKFNLPSWTYNKLVELYISWMTFFKETFKIKSITTDFNLKSQIPKINKPSILTDSELESTNKPDTYLYLTKSQWIYVTLSVIALLGAYFGYTGGIPFTKSFEYNPDPDNDNNPDYPNRGEGTSKGKGRVHSVRLDLKLDPKGRLVIDDSYNNTWQDTFTDLTTSIIDKIKKPFSWFSRSENIINEEETHPEEFSFWKKRQDAVEKLWQKRLKFWEKEDLDSEVKRGQLEKKGSLGDLDRDELRREYIESKNTSPTHPDPNLEQERNRLFPYSELTPSQIEAAKQQGRSAAEAYLDVIKNKEDNQLEARDSTETIRPSPSTTVSPTLRRKPVPPIITSETEDSDIEDRHTYPPRLQSEVETPWSVVSRRRPWSRGILFSRFADTPFARGFTEKLDPNNPIPTPESSPTPSPTQEPIEPTIEVQRGSLMFGSKFLNDMSKADGWREDDQ